jgi:hypothetical protein
MKYNIVTNYKINQIIKSQSKYYRVDLGQAITLESRSGDRELNENDKFAYVYNAHYKTGILRQGSIGDITFYTNHQILEDKIAFYIDIEEFIYSIDFNKWEEIGVDGYLGELLKISDEEYKKIQEDKKIVKEEVKIDSSEKIKSTPGNVRYDDLKAHIENLRRLQNSQ